MYNIAIRQKYGPYRGTYVTFGVYTGLAGLLMVILLWVLFTKCHLW